MPSETLYPTADVRVFENIPDTNYGADGYLSCRTMFGGNARSFLKFSLDTLPADATIILAKLRCYCYFTSNLVAGVTDIQARRVADDAWTETEVTWNNQPAYGDVEDTKVPAVGWVEWDVTSWVQNEWAGDKTVSICLRCAQESYDSTSRLINFYSKDYDGYDPELYVEYALGVAHSVAVSEKLGMVDGVARRVDYGTLVSGAEKLGLIDSITPKWSAHVTAAEKLGFIDAVAKVKAAHVAVAEKLGLVDGALRKAAYRVAAAEKLGLLDAARRVRGACVAVAEKLGFIDRERERKIRIEDLPDHTRRGGA